MVSTTNTFNQIMEEIKILIEDEITRKIIEYISDKDSFTEKEIKRYIKENLDIKLRDIEIRKILYILEEEGIIYPIEPITLAPNKFDYRWGNKVKNLYEIYKKLLDDKIKKLNESEEVQEDKLYYCPDCLIYYDFDSAFDNDFKCKECGGMLQEKENPILKQINITKEKIESFLENIKKKEKKSYTKLKSKKISK